MKKCVICKKATASVYRMNVRSVYSAKSYDLMHCRHCGHYFTNPTFSQADLNDIYDHKYSYAAHALIEKEKRMRAKKYANYIASLQDVSTAMEIGCMHGLLLEELQNRNIKVAGVELDPSAVAYCQARGLDVVRSSAENHLEKTSSKYDVIIMSHVIEHLIDPQKQLQALRERMPKTGKLVLITPNSRAFTRRLFGRFWGYWQVPIHINHFNISSVKKLLEQAGFEITEHKFHGADSLFFLSTLANFLGVTHGTQQLSPLKKLLVQAATALLRPWYFVGQEDMVVVASIAQP